MARYRRIPTVTEAVQFLGTPESREALEELADRSREAIGFVGPNEQNLVIETMRGIERATPGDFVIRGATGELYLCNPDIFEITYEPVVEDSLPSHREV